MKAPFATRTLFLVVLWALSLSVAFAFEPQKTPSGIEVKWSVPHATFYANTANGPSGSLPALQSALQTWTDVSASPFSFIYGGTTISTAWGVNDGVNVVVFGPLDQAGMVAENYLWYSSVTGEMWDSDIKVNTNYSFATDGSSASFDLQTILLHELGHALSLHDLQGPNDWNKVMYYQVSPGQQKRSLDQDDMDGLVHLYPPSSCGYSVSPAQQTFSSSPGTGTITVATTSSKCAWTAVTSDPSWITVQPGSGGPGDGTVSFAVSQNPGQSSRTGTITVAGNTFTVAQSGIEQRTLKVVVSGSGTGTVTSTPPAIDCGRTCSAFYTPGTPVTLKAAADSGSVFSGWSGPDGCLGTGDCSLILNYDTYVGAYFTEQQAGQYTINLSRGWNFVSTPLVPPSPQIGTVLGSVAGDTRLIWGYDNALKQWLLYKANPSNLFPYLDKIEAGKGHWMYMENPGSLTVSNNSVPTSIPLYEGWNLVGYSGRDGIRADKALFGIKEKWEAVWRWQNGNWEARLNSENPTLPSTPLLETLTRGKAYWVKMKAGQGNADWVNDLTPPEVAATYPVDHGTNVPVDSTVTVTFNEEIDPATATPDNLFLATDGGNVPGTVTCQGKTVTFTPSTNLSYYADYAATVTNVKDMAGNKLVSPHSWSFKTAPMPDSVIRTYKIGDTFTYAVTVTVPPYGQFGCDVTAVVKRTVPNPSGMACKEYEATGTIVVLSYSTPISIRSLFYQDDQGNMYGCGEYVEGRQAYKFIQNRENTPNGLSLELKNPVQVGDATGAGVVYYDDGTWDDCTGTVETKETVTTPRGTYQTYRVRTSCFSSDGSTSTETDWLYPSLYYVKTVGTFSNYPATLLLKSYSLVP